MKKFISRFVLVILPLLCIPIVNYTIDPSHIYDHYEQKIVSLLQHHPYVINVDQNMDERSFKKTLIDSCKTDIDMLIFGSSSVMSISESMFEGKHILNLGMSGATYEDIAALLYHYLSTGKCPRAVILGIDPQHFNANIGDTRWKTLQNEYAAYSKEVLSKPMYQLPDFEKWFNLLSLTYFQCCLKFDGDQYAIQTIDSVIHSDDIEHGAGLCKDGSLVYGRAFNNLSLQETNELAKNEAYSQWDNYAELSPIEIERWQQFIRYLQKKGIEVYIYESPYHPITFKRLNDEERYEMMETAMNYVDQFAEENTLMVIGSYNPSQCNLQECDFYDGTHVRKEHVAKLMESIFTNEVE